MRELNPNWTVSIIYLRHVLSVANSLGANKEELLKHSGIDALQLEDADGRLPIEKLITLLKAAAAKTHDQDLGLHIGRKGTLKSLGLLAYISMCCDTAEDAHRILPRYRKLLYDVGDTHIVPDGDLVKLTWTPLSSAYIADRHLTDALFSTWIKTTRIICTQALKPCEVHFTYPEPEDLSLLHDTFCDNLKFGQADNTLYFTRENFSTPMVGADQTMYRHLTEQAEKYISSLSENKELILTMKEALTRLLPHGDATIDSTAERLRMGKRTLQRRLSDQSTSFQKVLQELREELSIRFLCDNSLTLIEVALLLGYSDQSSFTTAFKSWHNISPRKYRLTVLNIS